MLVAKVIPHWHSSFSTCIQCTKTIGASNITKCPRQKKNLIRMAIFTFAHKSAVGNSEELIPFSTSPYFLIMYLFNWQAKNVRGKERDGKREKIFIHCFKLQVATRISSARLKSGARNPLVLTYTCTGISSINYIYFNLFLFFCRWMSSFFQDHFLKKRPSFPNIQSWYVCQSYFTINSTIFKTLFMLSLCFSVVINLYTLVPFYAISITITTYKYFIDS